jgi:hypothetical protein
MVFDQQVYSGGHKGQDAVRTRFVVIRSKRLATPLLNSIRAKRPSSPELRSIAYFNHQIPGTTRFVLAVYAAYSSPNASSIILSSARRRNANRIPNVTKYDGPTTQFGTTSA